MEMIRLAVSGKKMREYAHMYGQFHWGLSAWAFYIPAITAIGLIVFKDNEHLLRLSVVNNHLHKRISRTTLMSLRSLIPLSRPRKTLNVKIEIQISHRIDCF